MSHTPQTPQFKAGTIVTTLGALQVATPAQIAAILRRHAAGDWGEVDKEDAAANEHALKHGERLLSVYDVNGEKLWVITEANRSATTVLTPGEY
jgi:hypothetical protein